MLCHLVYNVTLWVRGRVVREPEETQKPIKPYSTYRSDLKTAEQVTRTLSYNEKPEGDTWLLSDGGLLFNHTTSLF